VIEFAALFFALLLYSAAKISKKSAERFYTISKINLTS